jgi:hypothetical protein
MARRQWRNVLGLLSAVLQLALPGVVVYADGRLAADTDRARPHIESDRSTNCQPVHSPDCGLCRVLANHAATPVPATTWIDIACGAYSPFSRTADVTHVRARELPPSRAPPTV